MKSGHFEVNSLELASCNVAACNEQEYIPCLVTDYPVHVTLTATAPTATVQVRLGDKGTVITGTVTDANTGEKLSALFELYPPKFPDRRWGMSSFADYYIFVAPLTDYSFEISVPGYKRWRYADHHLLHRSLRLAPQTHLVLDVKLHPLKNAP